MEVCAVNERARAERFHAAQDRKRFLVGRGLLRTILSLYVNKAPQALEFAYGPYGKPSLIASPGESSLQFNVSHSHALFLCAVARDLHVGIDIEYVRAMPDAAQITARFFSPWEYAAWHGLRATDRLESFFASWTRKEAFIKATEAGLSRPLDSFSVAVSAQEPARLLDVADDPETLVRFSIQDLPPIAGYKAALAVESKDWILECWEWPGSALRDY